MDRKTRDRGMKQKIRRFLRHYQWRPNIIMVFTALVDSSVLLE